MEILCGPSTSKSDCLFEIRCKTRQTAFAFAIMPSRKTASGPCQSPPTHQLISKTITLATIINIEGIDGSGKGTQAKLLCERLKEAGRSVALFSFPRYDDTLFGKSIGDFLNGRFGALEEVSPFLAALLYAGDRFESRELLLAAARENDYVVLDRYVASNIGHQASKVTGAERRELIDWITRIEYNIYQLPRPDLTILLSLPPQQAQQLIARKDARSYTDQAADIQEADAGYLSKVHDVYLEVARENPDWTIIEGLADGVIRPIEAIADEVWDAVQAVGQPSK